MLLLSTHLKSNNTDLFDEEGQSKVRDFQSIKLIVEILLDSRDFTRLERFYLIREILINSRFN